MPVALGYARPSNTRVSYGAGETCNDSNLCPALRTALPPSRPEHLEEGKARVLRGTR